MGSKYLAHTDKHLYIQYKIMYKNYSHHRSITSKITLISVKHALDNQHLIVLNIRD